MKMLIQSEKQELATLNIDTPIFDDIVEKLVESNSKFKLSFSQNNFVTLKVAA